MPGSSSIEPRSSNCVKQVLPNPHRLLQVGPHRCTDPVHLGVGGPNTTEKRSGVERWTVPCSPTTQRLTARKPLPASFPPSPSQRRRCLLRPERTQPPSSSSRTIPAPPCSTHGSQ